MLQRETWFKIQQSQINTKYYLANDQRWRFHRKMGVFIKLQNFLILEGVGLTTSRAGKNRTCTW